MRKDEKMNKLEKKRREVGSYSESFKFEVLSYRKGEGVSLMDASRFYDIPESTIRSWERAEENSLNDLKCGIFMKDDSQKIRE